MREDLKASYESGGRSVQWEDFAGLTLVGKGFRGALATA